MTINEAIKHCEEEAEKYMEYGIETECYQCGKEHEQLAEWLKELKELREENKVLIQECDRLIKEKGELLKKAADVQFVKHGKWSEIYHDSENYSAKCTNCGKPTVRRVWFKPYEFCPRCGADMRGDENG